ncbi:hypothetical protein D918_01849 [Trichuris suis]|uniref:S-adenosylmethionine decarboxylase proenzyme n=1 Tax=Trichuris suis TaxID=68888 RepID=A0A085MCI7_9BILA|nr:hypothetical protein M513_04115 [Trichuris suis]KHJ47693.1 hypothetical protein D918_01849 [Trichuris suis]
MSHVNANFFEGVEKLLEVWFESSRPTSESLRCIPIEEFERLTALANCQIVSRTSCEAMDAYVLSESSMFVSDRRFVLKTCGSTSLLRTIEPLLQIAGEYCNLDQVANVFYSHKNFLRPELQPEMHRHFEREVAQLDSIFENGAGYCLGRLNHDRWYLYTLNPANGAIPAYDQTMEILMSDLDANTMSCFARDVSCSASEARKLSGLDRLFQSDLIIDDKLFEPCGYSMNGIQRKSDAYVTVHITPEFSHSYVSFETNIHQTVCFEQLKNVVNCFKPKRFIFTAFVNKVFLIIAALLGSEEQRRIEYDLANTTVGGYRMLDCQYLRLPNHTLVYSYFVKSSASG